MFIDNKIIKIFRNFFLTKKSIEETQIELKQHRNTIIGTYDVKTSRMIWMSLLLYKFKDVMNVNDVLWNQTRQIIMSILKNLCKDDIDDILKEYIVLFDIWKKQDMENFIFEVASIYYNIMQIKKSIETTNNDTTINHWASNYETLLENIKNKCNKLGVLEKLNQTIETIDGMVEKQKYNVIKEVMNRAYWDKIKCMLENNDYTLVIENLSEIKNMIIEISPQKNREHNIKYIEDIFEIDYIVSIVEHKCLTIDYVVNLFTNIMLLLKEWDSDEFEKKYNIETIEDDNINNVIVILLEKAMVYTIDLNNRKAIWKKLLYI